MLLKLPNTRFYENPFCGSRVVCYKQSNIPYFPAHNTQRPIRRAVIFSLEILEKKIMNVF